MTTRKKCEAKRAYIRYVVGAGHRELDWVKLDGNHPLRALSVEWVVVVVAVRLQSALWPALQAPGAPNLLSAVADALAELRKTLDGPPEAPEMSDGETGRNRSSLGDTGAW
ncbi:hypothetical protein PCANC_15155 [Puccinia coronata f. sp. avenae]|uniref:Uncharacterized protein n=1 Tax=Puccinia coronata f. sp. avenae TaxID=200324 RepID=A0A2N5UJT1_9BASI|nr:hypothetical protein PCANC_15155 [Puccinia coronata f. sp. avenae]